eukprot:CAMPEP_0183735996 /NCGR_PEP_ID=MMETSP0737-20130205/48174_1 /TAXON_ID=385413 /ORGANISM="Thalassiosira miniscula, Strain CCMP1093" /LENGTH=290 /DNA_ID=CAMNT_0025969889 /DNA_START=128 /DNA_END=998 /DNA_ORIENTATION=-
MKRKFQSYISVYDGTVKPYKDVESEFEGLFHDDFVHTLDGRPIDKKQMRDVIKILLSIGTKVDLVLYKPLDESTFEAKLKIFNRILNNVQTHSKGTIQEGQLVKFEAYEDASKVTFARVHSIVGLSEVKQNLEYFIERQNDTGVSFDGIGDAFNCLFLDSIAACILGATLNMRGMRTSSRSVPDNFFETTSTYKLTKCEVIDETHIDVEVEKTSVSRDHKMTRKVWNDVLTVKDACIALIEPYRVIEKEVNFGKRRRSSSSSNGPPPPYPPPCSARYDGPCVMRYPPSDD